MGQGARAASAAPAAASWSPPRTAAWSPPTATSSPRSIAASTASRAISSPRSCTAHDRLTQPMLRKTQRQVRQERRVHAGLLGRGVRRHGREVQGRAEEAGAERRRHVRLGPVDHLGRLCGGEAVQGRLPLQQHRSQCAPLHGLGGRGLHAHLRHRRADGLLRRHRGDRRVRAVGLEHGRDAPDPVDAGDRPPAVRAACAGRRALDLRAPLLRPGRHRRSCSSRRPIS